MVARDICSQFMKFNEGYFHASNLTEVCLQLMGSLYLSISSDYYALEMAGTQLCPLCSRTVIAMDKLLPHYIMCGMLFYYGT